MHQSLLMLALSLAACVPPDAADAAPYEDCKPGYDAAHAVCQDGVTTCLGWPIRSDNAFDDGAGICSSVCETDADCTPLPGHVVVCEPFSRGRRCVVACSAGGANECPRGTTCETLDRGNGSEARRCTP